MRSNHCLTAVVGLGLFTVLFCSEFCFAESRIADTESSSQVLTPAVASAFVPLPEPPQEKSEIQTTPLQVPVRQTFVVLPVLHSGSNHSTFGDVSRLMANEASEQIQKITTAKVISPLEWDSITRAYGLKASSEQLLASCQFGGRPDFEALQFIIDKLKYNGVSIDGIVFLQAVIDRQHTLEPKPQERFVWLKQLLKEPRHDAYYRIESIAKLYQPKQSATPIWQQQVSSGLAYRDFSSVSASVYDDPSNYYLFQKQLIPVTQSLLLTFPGQIMFQTNTLPKKIQLNVTGAVASEPKVVLPVIKTP